MEIAKAEITDAERILEVQKIAYLSEAKRYNDFEIPPLHQTLAELRQEFSTHVFLKASVQSLIVGSVRGLKRNDSCDIGRLIVLPDFQGKGIGSALLQEIEKYFADSKRFELFTGSSSTDNLNLYKKHGYEEFKLESLSNTVSLVYMEKLIR